MITLKQVKAAMTYGSLIAETVKVGAYTIEFAHDQDSENPYDAWEGNTPALWVSLRRHSVDIEEYGDSDLESFFAKMSRHWISRHWRAICKILDLTESEHDREAREHAVYYCQSLSESRADLFSDALGDMKGSSWSYALDYLEDLRALYRLAGVQAETFQRDGYCQGDSVYGLIVMTPAWAENVGAPHAKPGQIDQEKCAKDMESQADIFGAWAFGDVYGYIVTETASGDDVGSCWGFYGDSLEDSGLWENLQNSIECYESQHLARKLAKVKAWIKNKTPLGVRADLLAVL